MGRHYRRKTSRASWTADALNEAMSKVINKELGVNQASRDYGIPSRTLRRHLRSGREKGPLGRNPELGAQCEKKLVNHIQALEKVGFSPNKKDVTNMAFAIAEKMSLEHRFSKSKQKAGDEWFYAFMRRHKEIVLRKSEGLSLARAQGMNRKDVEDYFNVLQDILTKNDIIDNPGKIYNVDETGIQVNNKVGRVLATKGAKEVFTLTSAEKGENVSVIACCNAEGHFLPPVLIFKGKNKKPEFSEGLPPGSDVYMNQKSSYISSELFYKWFTEHFIPKKGTGKALLLLDGHGSHSNSIDLLEAAVANDVILLCFPSHTTHALQPLDRAFFKPFKTYFNQETKIWMTNHKERKLTLYYIAQLVGNAWYKAATISNGVSAMRCTGVYPFNPSAIPDYFFCIESSSIEPTQATTTASTIREESAAGTSKGERPSVSNPLSGSQIQSLVPSNISAEERPENSNCNSDQRSETIDNLEVIIEPVSPSILSPTPDIHEPMRKSPLINSNEDHIPKPSLNRLHQNITYESTGCINQMVSGSGTRVRTAAEKKETPSKILKDIHPIPVIPQYQVNSRKQKTTVFTSIEFIAKKVELKEGKQRSKRKTPKGKTTTERTAKEKTTEEKENRGKKTTKKRKQRSRSSESEEGKKTNPTEHQTKKKKLSLQQERKKNTIVKKAATKQKRQSSYSTDTEDEEDGIELALSNEQTDTEENACTECFEDYNVTKKQVDWIQCTRCFKWLHEDCTMYNNLCNKCGRYTTRQQKN